MKYHHEVPQNRPLKKALLAAFAAAAGAKQNFS